MDRGCKHIDRVGDGQGLQTHRQSWDGQGSQTHRQSWGWTGFAYTLTEPVMDIGQWTMEMKAELRKFLTHATETEQEVFFSTDATMLPASSRNSSELVIKLPGHIDTIYIFPEYIRGDYKD
jgi:hypothetical protein